MEISNHSTHCIVCNNELLHLTTNKKKKYCSYKCKNKFHQANCYEKQKIRALKRKEKFIKLCGGSCIVCGYKKNYAALCFHHTNPNKKSFPLDARNLSNRTMKILTLEMKKCVLLCMNCHAEHHHPTHTKP